MADTTPDHARRSRTFSLRTLMLVVTVCAVFAAITGRTRSYGLPWLCLAGFLAVAGFACYETASRMELTKREGMIWLASCVMLIGSLSIWTAIVALVSGLLTAVSQLVER